MLRGREEFKMESIIFEREEEKREMIKNLDARCPRNEKMVKLYWKILEYNTGSLKKIARNGMREMENANWLMEITHLLFNDKVASSWSFLISISIFWYVFSNPELFYQEYNTRWWIIIFMHVYLIITNLSFRFSYRKLEKRCSKESMRSITKEIF